MTGDEQGASSDEEGGHNRNGDSDSSGGGLHSDVNEDDGKSAAGRKRGRGSAVEEAPRKRLVSEPSHLGMARQAEERGAAAKGSALAQLSVADQENLALSMLLRRR